MNTSRRDFLEKMGWGAFVVAGGTFAFALARFLEPNVTTPAPGPVDVGKPEDFAPGSLTYIDKARAYLGHDERGFYAIAAICTHLGCTPHLAEGGGGFVCPCHGSRFTRDGQVVSGPAIKALARAYIGRGTTGQLFIDRSRVVNTDFRLLI